MYIFGIVTLAIGVILSLYVSKTDNENNIHKVSNDLMVYSTSLALVGFVINTGLIGLILCTIGVVGMWISIFLDVKGK